MKYIEKHIIKAVLIAFNITSSIYSYSQDEEGNCHCPPIIVYIYDTKVDFKPDTFKSAADAGKYTEALNSGSWLGAEYLKQQSDELKIFQNYLPGEKVVHTYQPPPSDGNYPDNVDFISYAEVSRSGDQTNYSYLITVVVKDVVQDNVIIKTSLSTTDLGQTDDLIANCVQSFSPVLDHFRNYQKKLREESGYTKWIYLKWKVTVDKKNLKAGQSTIVHIKLFDCADQEPAKGKTVKLSLTETTKGRLSQNEIVTNDAGEASVTFKAGTEDGEVMVAPHYSFDRINGKSAQATRCDDDPSIIIGDNYKISITIEATGHADNGAPLHCLIKGEQNVFCQLKDKDSCCSNWQNTEMKFKVIDLRFVNKNGTMVYTGPKEFSNAFQLSLDLCKKQPTFVISFSSFGPKQENFTVPSGSSNSSLQLTHIISTLYKSILGDVSIKHYKDFDKSHNSNDMVALSQRLEQHNNDPAYFKTAQGKKDLADLSQIKKDFGPGDRSSPNSAMTSIQASYNKSASIPVNISIKANLLTQHSGSGWDKGTITLKMEKQTL